MKAKNLFWAGILSSFALAACAPSANKTSELQINANSIIGGTEVQAGSAIQQSIVAVYDNEAGGLCTGTLIAKNVVLTAAHCVGSDVSQMFIIFDTKINSNSVHAKADNAIVSPGWESHRGQSKDTSDIALIYFTGQLPMGYAPAELISDKDKKLLKRGTWVILAGFGISDGITHEGAGTLRMTQVQIEDPTYSATELTLNQKAGTGACHGDSGGPAFIQIKGKYYLWGVTSRGILDAKNDCSQYAAYTSAVSYRKWIARSDEKMLASATSSMMALAK